MLDWIYQEFKKKNMGGSVGIRQVLVDVPANQLNSFLDYIKSKHYEMLLTDDFDISEEDKQLVRNRKANHAPEDLKDWDSIQDSFKLE